MAFIDDIVVVGSAAALRTNPAYSHKNVATILTGITKVGDSHGGHFVYDVTSTLADNGYTVIRPTGVTVGAWVRLSKYQDTVHFEQNGPLVGGSFSRLVARGGYYGSFFARLGTAGSSATTVGIAVDGVTVATITYASGATTGTISYVAGATLAALNGSKFTFTVTAGTNAADLTMVLDV